MEADDSDAHINDEDDVSNFLPNVTYADSDDEAFQELGPDFGLDRARAPNHTPGDPKPYLFKFDEHTRRGLKMEDGEDLRFRVPPPVLRDSVIRKIMNFVMLRRRQQGHPRAADFTIMVCRKDGRRWHEGDVVVPRPAAREKNHYIVLPRNSVRQGAEPPMEFNVINSPSAAEVPETEDADPWMQGIHEEQAAPVAAPLAAPAAVPSFAGQEVDLTDEAPSAAPAAAPSAAPAAAPSFAGREVELTDQCICLICGAILKEVVFMTAVPCGDTCICIGCATKQVSDLPRLFPL